MGELVQFEASKRLYLSQKSHSLPAFLAWCRAADIGKSDFLRPQAGEAAIRARRIECHTEYREVLKEHNLPAFVVHYPTESTDIYVTRAVVPGLRHMWPRFAAGRLYDTPCKLGWHKSKITEDEVNPIAILY
jgi:ribosomal protein S12 methylthiotransferase accessory factor